MPAMITYFIYGGVILQELIGKCGNSCGICPWGRYHRAELNDEQWAEYRAAAKKYVGYSPAENPCHGCQTPDAKLGKDVGVHNFLRGCLARKCATHNGIANCTYCSRYPCDWIEAQVNEITRESVSKRLGEPVPDLAYESFIEPFQGKSHLDRIRVNLSDDDIVEPKTFRFPVKKTVEYPTSAHLPGVESKAVRSAYDILAELASSDFGLNHTDTLVGTETIKNRRVVLFRLLWIAFANGAIQSDGATLVLDGFTYAANKKGKDPLTMIGRAEKYFKMLEGIGINAALYQLHDEWTTESGYLRTHIPGTQKPAWNLAISFEKRIGGANTLHAMKAYADILLSEFKARAYQRFASADMNMLTP